jgi:hypothetical protein
MQNVLTCDAVTPHFSLASQMIVRPTTLKVFCELLESVDGSAESDGIYERQVGWVVMAVVVVEILAEILVVLNAHTEYFEQIKSFICLQVYMINFLTHSTVFFKMLVSQNLLQYILPHCICAIFCTVA